MVEQHANRRLAAILSADVVGFSRLMQADEVGTLEELKRRRGMVMNPLVAKYQGRIVKVMGDGVLVEFGSAVNAVQCALDVQAAMARANAPLQTSMQIHLRIGVNLGDVIVEGRDIYGDGVNVAARLESLADPGNICISAGVHEQVKRRLDVEFEDLGRRVLKNIAEPLQVYRVSTSPGVQATGKAEPSPPQLPAKPSIAVLPFTNMSGESDQDVFADGLTEDLITDLSRNAGLFVIARHSTMAYKGRAVDIRQAARELGVRYVLEGSARRAADRVRINVQLIDAAGGDHMWAERFDRKLEDIFDVQDEVTRKIVEALVGRLAALPSRNRPKNLEAYELCVQARPLIANFAGSSEAIREADILLRQAVALEPGYAEAVRWRAFVLWSRWAHVGSPEATLGESVGLALRAVELDPNDAGNHWVAGYLQAYERRWTESDAAFAAALRLDPNHADTLVMRGEIVMWAGDFEQATELVLRAFRLNPLPAGWYFWILGMIHFATGRYELAIDVLRNEATYRSGSRKILAAALAMVGRERDALREAEILVANTPHFSLTRWAAAQPARETVLIDQFVTGMRRAGLPD